LQLNGLPSIYNRMKKDVPHLFDGNTRNIIILGYSAYSLLLAAKWFPLVPLYLTAALIAVLLLWAFINLGVGRSQNFK